MSLCGKIAANVAANCANPLQSGVEDSLTIINRDDWLNAAIGLNADPQIIESIVLAMGITGFLYQGKNNSNIPKYEFIKQTFSEVYNHEINFKVFDVNPTVKAELEAMAKGSFVVIVSNKFHGEGGNAAFEVYGADAGLTLSQNIREINNVENGGAFDLILKSDDTALEPHMPKTLFLTSYAISKAIVDGLTA